MLAVDVDVGSADLVGEFELLQLILLHSIDCAALLGLAVLRLGRHVDYRGCHCMLLRLIVVFRFLSMVELLEAQDKRNSGSIDFRINGGYGRLSYILQAAGLPG